MRAIADCGFRNADIGLNSDFGLAGACLQCCCVIEDLSHAHRSVVSRPLPVETGGKHHPAEGRPQDYSPEALVFLVFVDSDLADSVFVVLLDASPSLAGLEVPASATAAFL